MQRNRSLSFDWQRQYCLSEEHVDCPYFSRGAANSERGGFLGRMSANKREILVLAIALAILLTALAAIAAIGAPPSDDSQSGDEAGDGAVITSSTQTPTPGEAATGAPQTPQSAPSPTTGAAVDDQPTATSEPSGDAEFEIGGDALEIVWNRLDLPVRAGEVDRTWLWGPAPITEALEEPYVDAPGGVRTVQYFDKSRMEINDPDADANANWYVTTGLLVVEMVYGHYQVGDNEVDDSPTPADRPILDVVGDEVVPTYAEIQSTGLDIAEPIPEGNSITQTIVDGSVVSQEEFQEYNVVSEVIVENGSTEHAIASVFWEFMTSEGVIWQDGDFLTDVLFVEPYFAIGYPITEAYWVTADVDGAETDILWQCFERRCLTYTPSNEPGWEVEASNVGVHYYEWRYSEES